MLQRMLGHSSVALMLERYGHLFEDEFDGVWRIGWMPVTRRNVVRMSLRA
ncbi:hypothetical protein AB0C34_13485 [Nocardia sp. NPDC049220]